jgi:60 kDa SS-A/Ro ribonucleoprotein
MAHWALFGSSRGRKVPQANAVNAAGGAAYALGPKEALARYAATGCISDTYYVKAEQHLEKVLGLAAACDPLFVAKVAVFARTRGFMKDLPALLLATLATRGDEGRAALKAAFPAVIDNGRMLRTFVQIVRSGKLGRKSFGHGPKRLVQGFFESSPTWLFRQLSTGQSPSGADVVKMVHPKGKTPEHDALLGYLIGKVSPGDEKWARVPPIVAQLEAWKADRSLDPPAVPFELLTAKPLDAAQWARVIRNGQWHFIRMNLNTAIRHGALEADPGLEQFIADRLRDPESIRKARVMPYQLLAAYKHVGAEVPRPIVDALHDAMEIAIGNVPATGGRLLVVVDVSGSMGSPVTGSFGAGQPASKVRCVDVAALFAAAMLRRNPAAKILPVDTSVHLDYQPEPRDSVMTNAVKLAAYCGGGTALSAGFAHVNAFRLRFDHVVVVSDSESWADAGYGPGTGLMHEWETLRSRNPGASLVCIDITPARTHQIAPGHSEILHVAGWSDAVFDVVSAFLGGDALSWVAMIERTVLPTN